MPVVLGAAVVDEPPVGPGVVPVVGDPADPDGPEDVVETLSEADELVEPPAGTILPPNTTWGADALAVRAFLSYAASDWLPLGFTTPTMPDAQWRDTEQ